MSIKQIKATFTALNGAALLFNNPQTVDPSNAYTREIKKITSKRTKSDEDLENLHNLEVRAKLYWDEEDGVVLPTTWVTAAIHSVSHKLAKISKANSRSGVFALKPTTPLRYSKRNTVKTPEDIVNDHYFRRAMILKQQQVKICKSAPCFNDWSFSVDLAYDEDVYDLDTLKRLLTHAAMYGGFGDFRPTNGRATVEITEITEA